MQASKCLARLEIYHPPASQNSNSTSHSNLMVPESYNDVLPSPVFPEAHCVNAFWVVVTSDEETPDVVARFMTRYGLLEDHISTCTST
jgi:hypothetical protein